MLLALASLLAGVFSALSPCVLPLIPMMLGTHAQGGNRRSSRVLLGLALSVIAFSVLLKSTTLLIDVPQQIWQIVGGGIVALFGASLLWPSLGEKFVLTSRFGLVAQQAVGNASTKQGALRDILLGASLGPLFNVCSPTYALIVAVLLPANPLQGLSLLFVYTLGLTLTLFAVAVGGSTFVHKLGWSLDTHGKFRRILGALLLLIGIAVVLGLDKKLQGLLVSSGLFDWQVNLESLIAQ
ncbi:sulfite exporter TauE/SafE family protein [Candidatus Saccharibacteria bacterium]|nr:MAG: sulfite exporter TauE/SafE family protein [Candidatus Saccharibacteria bacterium]